MNQGFLGTAAPLVVDLILLLEIGMGVGLLIGAWFARTRRIRQHAWCQSIIVILNAIVIALVMVPSFLDRVAPKIPARLGRPYYALATAHAALGGIAEVAAIYVIFSAGTSWLPERIRIKRYKFWMRSVLLLWWIVLLLGIATYSRWYMARR